jgi:hypothetical protein
MLNRTSGSVHSLTDTAPQNQDVVKDDERATQPKQVTGSTSDALVAVGRRNEASIRAVFSSRTGGKTLQSTRNEIAPDSLKEIFSSSGPALTQLTKRIEWTSANTAGEKTRNKVRRLLGTRTDLQKMSDFIRYMASSNDFAENEDDPTLVDYRRTFGNETLCLSVGRNEKGEINFAFLGDVGASSEPRGNASTPQGNPLVPTSSIPVRITEDDLGRIVGSGADKDVYQLKEHQDLVVAIQKATEFFSSDEELHTEAQLLAELARRGFPTVTNYGVVSVGNRKGILQEYIPGAVTARDPEALRNLNWQSIEDLDIIRRLLIEHDMHIVDFQLLIGGNGRVYVTDPMAIEPGTDHTQLEFVDHLRNAALSTS